MGRLDGKVALVTGGARGMGASHARGFVAEGARVVIGDVRDDDGARIAAELGDACRYVHLDVTDHAQWQAAVQSAVDEFGRLDILVNNAGINGLGHIEEHSLETWHQVIAVNLTGVFYGIKAATEPLTRSGNGSIINISSTAGLKGFPDRTSYIASKYGVRGLTKGAAIDLGRYNIRVNSVHPGWVETPLTAGRIGDGLDAVALQRSAKPEEVTKLVVYLASDESSYSTGSEFIVDGGQVAGTARD